MHKDDAKQSPGKQQDYDEPFIFKISKELLLDNIKENGLMDCGATSHIVTEESKFTRFVNPQQHCMKLADRENNMALKQGDAEVMLQDQKGRNVTVTLKRALFIPSYPQSVLSATAEGAKVVFQNGESELATKEGAVLCIKELERLYYTEMVNNSDKWVDCILTCTNRRRD